MNCEDSTITSLTKTSLLHKNSHNIPPPPTATVFLAHQHRLHTATLPLDALSVQEFISQAIQEFQTQGIDQAAPEIGTWSLLASKKNGKKYSDLPSLDPTQKIEKTGFKNFLLRLEEASPRKSNSGGRIMTQFCAQRKLQIKPKENKSCLCFQL